MFEYEDEGLVLLNAIDIIGGILIFITIEVVGLNYCFGLIVFLLLVLIL